MQIIIEPHGTYAIYEQIVNQMKNAIVSGELTANEALPSIRGLAAEIGVSVITTKRAYEELERDGFIQTVAGKGSFVAQQNLELARESNLREIEQHLQAALELARQIALPTEELHNILTVLSEED